MNLTDFISNYGLPAVFAGAAVEGETEVLLGGFAAERGLLEYSHVVLAAIFGSFLADQLLFALGRYASGFHFLKRVTGSSAARQITNVLERHPTAFVLGFRFVYGVRIVSPVVIGLSKISATKFVALNSLAAAIWGTMFATIGYLGGHTLQALYARLDLHIHLLAAMAMVGLLAMAALAIIKWATGRHPPFGVGVGGTHDQDR